MLIVKKTNKYAQVDVPVTTVYFVLFYKRYFLSEVLGGTCNTEFTNINAKPFPSEISLHNYLFKREFQNHFFF